MLFKEKSMLSKQPTTLSCFEPQGFEVTISNLIEEIQEIYLADEIPWVVGYSGGKDSTATLQLIWMALQNLPHDKLHKPVHVISTDTRVENPIVAIWVTASIVTMTKAAKDQNLPITPHLLKPEATESFWVNLLGKGYPSPRRKFRWCTLRLKIMPSNDFIHDMVKNSGEAIVVLGTRKAESQARAKVMTQSEAKRIRDKLSPNESLANSLVYSPIEEWTNDDVWSFLLTVTNPWGVKNHELFEMYQGATDGGECPFVTDINGPSCGGSRFGCWVCTMVDEDKSMGAMIRNDTEKDWMLPLLDFRNELANKDDRSLRDFRRMTGVVTVFNGRLIHGPYTQEVREKWLRKLLRIQKILQENGPEEVKSIELISIEELLEIRKIWIVKKCELEDNLPNIYKEETGKDLPVKQFDENTMFGPSEMALLKNLCDGDELHFQLIRELLAVEKKYQMMANRAGLFDQLKDTVRHHFWRDEEDATERALVHKKALEEAESGNYIDITNISIN